MPETSELYDTLARLSGAVSFHRIASNDKTYYRSLRDELIREAHKAGASFPTLASETGLSRAQVQRICDYSKDRSNKMKCDGTYDCYGMLDESATVNAEGELRCPHGQTHGHNYSKDGGNR